MWKTGSKSHKDRWDNLANVGEYDPDKAKQELEEIHKNVTWIKENEFDLKLIFDN